MRYKCHYCGEFLKPGATHTLECDCGNCSLGFEKSGKVDHFILKSFEKGKSIFLFKYKANNSIFYGIGKSNLNNPWVSKIVMEINATLHFDKENVPQVYALWEKLDKLKAFS